MKKILFSGLQSKYYLLSVLAIPFEIEWFEKTPYALVVISMAIVLAFFISLALSDFRPIWYIAGFYVAALFANFPFVVIATATCFFIGNHIQCSQVDYKNMPVGSKTTLVPKLLEIN